MSGPSSGDLLPILFAVRVSAPISNHTVWEHPAALQEKKGEVEMLGTSPLMVRVFGVVHSATPFHFYHLPGWTKKVRAPPEYKRGAISSKRKREIIKHL